MARSTGLLPLFTANHLGANLDSLWFNNMVTNRRTYRRAAHIQHDARNPHHCPGQNRDQLVLGTVEVSPGVPVLG
jgi:hypothetical protein